MSIPQILTSKKGLNTFISYELHIVHLECGEVLDQAQGNVTNLTEGQASTMKRIGE